MQPFHPAPSSLAPHSHRANRLPSSIDHLGNFVLFNPPPFFPFPFHSFPSAFFFSPPVCLIPVSSVAPRALERKWVSGVTVTTLTLAGSASLRCVFCLVFFFYESCALMSLSQFWRHTNGIAFERSSSFSLVLFLSNWNSNVAARDLSSTMSSPLLFVQGLCGQTSNGTHPVHRYGYIEMHFDVLV